VAYPESSTEADTERIAEAGTSPGPARTMQLPPGPSTPQGVALQEKPPPRVKVRRAPPGHGAEPEAAPATRSTDVCDLPTSEMPALAPDPPSGSEKPAETPASGTDDDAPTQVSPPPRPDLILKPMPQRAPEPREADDLAGPAAARVAEPAADRPVPSGPGRSVKVVSPPTARINLANLRPIPTGTLPAVPAPVVPAAPAALASPPTAPTGRIDRPLPPGRSVVPGQIPADPIPLRAGPKQGRQEAVRRAMLVLAAALVVGLAVMAGLLTNRTGGTTTARPTATPSATATSGAARALSAELSSFDPKGTGFRREGDTWTTQRYRSASFGGLKPGAGLMLDLGSVTPVRSVSFTPGPGTLEVELRAANTPGGAASDYTVLGRADADERTTIAATGSHRYLLLWVTHLAPGDGGYKGTLADITVSG
jgi:hypothetical protein